MSDYALMYNYCDPIGGTYAAIKQYRERCYMVEKLRYAFKMTREEAVRCLEENSWDEVKARGLCT